MHKWPVEWQDQISSRKFTGNGLLSWLAGSDLEPGGDGMGPCRGEDEPLWNETQEVEGEVVNVSREKVEPGDWLGSKDKRGKMKGLIFLELRPGVETQNWVLFVTCWVSDVLGPSKWRGPENI